ncbi:hypothetical protein DFH27DRAFT_613433 [Peziza echinospora]|nr:hypothetical protein DFH27DRAFT_613433 [Peziza echinospora]
MTSSTPYEHTEQWLTSPTLRRQPQQQPRLQHKSKRRKPQVTMRKRTTSWNKQTPRKCKGRMEEIDHSAPWISTITAKAMNTKGASPQTSSGKKRNLGEQPAGKLEPAGRVTENLSNPNQTHNRAVLNRDLHNDWAAKATGARRAANTLVEFLWDAEVKGRNERDDRNNPRLDKHTLYNIQNTAFQLFKWITTGNIAQEPPMGDRKLEGLNRRWAKDKFEKRGEERPLLHGSDQNSNGRKKQRRGKEDWAEKADVTRRAKEQEADERGKKALGEARKKAEMDMEINTALKAFAKAAATSESIDHDQSLKVTVITKKKVASLKADTGKNISAALHMYFGVRNVAVLTFSTAEAARQLITRWIVEALKLNLWEFEQVYIILEEKASVVCRTNLVKGLDGMKKLKELNPKANFEPRFPTPLGPTTTSMFVNAHEDLVEVFSNGLVINKCNRPLLADPDMDGKWRIQTNEHGCRMEATKKNKDRYTKIVNRKYNPDRKPVQQWGPAAVCSFCNRKTHTAAECYSQKPENKPINAVAPCFRCGERRHWGTKNSPRKQPAAKAGSGLWTKRDKQEQGGPKDKGWGKEYMRCGSRVHLTIDYDAIGKPTKMHTGLPPHQVIICGNCGGNYTNPVRRYTP